MPASIVFGKLFEEVFDDAGEIRDIIPVDGSYEFVHRTKLLSAIELCKPLIAEELWPVYDVGVCAKVPLEDAVLRVRQLIPKLLSIKDQNEIQVDDFLQMLVKHIDKGCLFFIVM